MTQYKKFTSSRLTDFDPEEIDWMSYDGNFDEIEEYD